MGNSSSYCLFTRSAAIRLSFNINQLMQYSLFRQKFKNVFNIQNFIDDIVENLFNEDRTQNLPKYWCMVRESPRKYFDD